MIKEIEPTDKIKDSRILINDNFKELEKLTKNTRGIKIATWITAVSTLLLAIVSIVALVISLRTKN